MYSTYNDFYQYEGSGGGSLDPTPDILSTRQGGQGGGRNGGQERVSGNHVQGSCSYPAVRSHAAILKYFSLTLVSGFEAEKKRQKSEAPRSLGQNQDRVKTYLR